MTAMNGDIQGLSLNGRWSKDLVSVEDYEIFPKPSANQKLSPLDMNMPRMYGSRWILCFSLSADADRAKVYGQTPLRLPSDLIALTFSGTKT